MSWINAFITMNLIGIAANLDNCGVGIAYGSKKIKFPHWVNAIINTIGFCTTLLGTCAGEVISHYMTGKQAAWASCIVLVCIGLFFWYSAYLHPRISRKHEKIKIKKPNWKQGVILGISLSFTNIASGFGATVSNASSIWVTTVAITIWGYIMIWLGNVVGIGILARMLSKYSSFVAGFILILIGIHQISG